MPKSWALFLAASKCFYKGISRFVFCRVVPLPKIEMCNGFHATNDHLKQETHIYLGLNLLTYFKRRDANHCPKESKNINTDIIWYRKEASQQSNLSIITIASTSWKAYFATFRSVQPQLQIAILPNPTMRSP